MTTINIYLIFNGNCEEAFNFYRSVIGGGFSQISRYNEMPGYNDKTDSAMTGKKIMHISLRVSKETVLMGSDGGGDWAKFHKEGNNFSISIGTDGLEEADRLFNGLSMGGTIKMPMETTF